MLRGPYVSVAIDLQEAADMMHSDVRSRLNDAVQSAHQGTGKYAYYVDHNGDGESGDCVYGCDGQTMSAPYEIQDQGDKSIANIDTSNAQKVAPRTTYDPIADDDDNYASMMEAKLYTKGDAKPLCERFISKDERDKADGESFAGKNKSFPILKPGDVMAAVRSIGRAGSDNYGAGTLKTNIVRIAKAKGFESELPKAWRGTEAAKPTESAKPTAGALKLVESAAFVQELPLRESGAPRTNYPIKIIDAGTGSTAHYSAEMLKREAAKFKPGTLMFWNHPTPAEEAARPEGNLDHLAAITTSQGEWKDNGPKGPGIYAEAKVMADYAQKVAERAPHIGLSIRAGGIREGDKSVGGKPLLKEFSYIESVDYVTKAGRGGVALAEAARDAGILQEVEMTQQEITALVESAVTKAVAAVQSPIKSLEARALRGDALIEANRILGPLALPEAAKDRVADTVTREGAIPVKEGAVDVAKFTELVMLEAKREGAYLAQIKGRGQVIDMGTGAPVTVDPKIREAELARAKDEEADAISVFESLGMPADAAKLAAKGRAA